uniref:Uncharacterized protein n=1 Tax=Cucumis melo TaxID=3656 RepID=A0A9I9EK14_CUCME
MSISNHTLRPLIVNVDTVCTRKKRNDIDCNHMTSESRDVNVCGEGPSRKIFSWYNAYLDGHKRKKLSFSFFKIPPFPSLRTFPFPSSKSLPSRTTAHDENPNLNPILLMSTIFLLGDEDPRRGDPYRRQHIKLSPKPGPLNQRLIGVFPVFEVLETYKEHRFLVFFASPFPSLTPQRLCPFSKEIKVKGDFMAMGGIFKKKRMKMNVQEFQSPLLLKRIFSLMMYLGLFLKRIFFLFVFIEEWKLSNLLKTLPPSPLLKHDTTLLRVEKKAKETIMSNWSSK